MVTDIGIVLVLFGRRIFDGIPDGISRLGNEPSAVQSSYRAERNPTVAALLLSLRSNQCSGATARTFSADKSGKGCSVSRPD